MESQLLLARAQFGCKLCLFLLIFAKCYQIKRDINDGFYKFKEACFITLKMSLYNCISIRNEK